MTPFTTKWFREQRAITAERWYLWPMLVVLFIYGLGGLLWCIYNDWWSAAALTAVWLVALVTLLGPSRHGWQRRRTDRDAR
jgi:membrane protein YdbS with pleckstrin-like domain